MLICEWEIVEPIQLERDEQSWMVINQDESNLSILKILLPPEQHEAHDRMIRITRLESILRSLFQTTKIYSNLLELLPTL